MEIKSDLGSGNQITNNMIPFQTMETNCPFCKQVVELVIPSDNLMYRELYEEVNERLKDSISHNGELYNKIIKLQNKLISISKVIDL